MYGLLNFYREYVPNFAEVSEPLRKLLSQDSLRWTPESIEAVRLTVAKALSGVPWLAFDPSQELRMETRLVPEALSVLLL